MTLVGETLHIPERVIVAPIIGTLRWLRGDSNCNDGRRINRGDVIGVVHWRGGSTPVRSPFAGLLLGVLAEDGQRVRAGQPVAWLRVR
jgi:hypothetical protein